MLRVMLRSLPRLPVVLSLAAVALLAAGCPASTQSKRPTILPVREVSRGGGVPEIIKIVDLGAMRLPKEGPLTVGTGDGQGTIGELLLLWGKELGKQPSVHVGEEPTDVLAHVSGGGIVVRIPWGIPSGPTRVKVTTRGGSTSLRYPIRRVGLVGDAKGLRSFALGKGGKATIGAPLALLGVQALTTSPDASVAYAVVAQGGKLALVTIDLTTQQPREVTRDPLPGKTLFGLARANRGTLVVAVTDTHVVYVDASVGTVPALFKPLPLPRSLDSRPMTGVALSPDGKTLAMLAEDKNQLVLFDASKPTTLPAPQLLDVLPAARLPMVHSAAFSLDGKKVWVLGGDTKASIAAGHQAAQLVAFTLEAGRASGEPARWIASEDLAPAATSMARSAPTPAGTAIRTQTASSALYITAHTFERLSKGGSADGGVLLRAVENKPVEKLLGGSYLLGAVRVVGRPQILVVVGTRGKGKGFERVLMTRQAWDDQANTEVSVVAPLSDLGAPPHAGLLVVQR
ncbi:MAG: hypothetical protein CSA24_00210 [Deltaproteobacteria bacterium]|nr:MAG: hypothetical protein CSA24_00210 [Deltaproteobacteria bacterium]